MNRRTAGMVAGQARIPQELEEGAPSPDTGCRLVSGRYLFTLVPQAVTMLDMIASSSALNPRETRNAVE
jgi:hypothetical protein